MTLKSKMLIASSKKMHGCYKSIYKLRKNGQHHTNFVSSSNNSIISGNYAFFEKSKKGKQYFFSKCVYYHLPGNPRAENM